MTLCFSRSMTTSRICICLRPLPVLFSSRQELLNRIWGTDYVGETRTVDVHIGQLRKKLGFHDVIRTISKPR